MLGFRKRKMTIRRSARAERDMPCGWAPVTRMKFSSDSSRSLLTQHIFSEDPRYYRMGEGPAGRRLLHALTHAVVAYNDNGKPMFNFSEWLGEISGTSITNLYHPGNQRGFGPAAQGIAFDVAMDVGFDELREFWPEVCAETSAALPRSRGE